MLRRRAVLLMLGVLAGVALAAWLLRPGPKRNDGQVSLSPALLSQAVEVVALAENGKNYRGAIDGWSQLLAARPNDRDLLLNQAVTVLKWIADTNSLLSSGTVTQPEKVAELEQQLDDAYREAQRVLDRLTELPLAEGESAGHQVLLESALLETRARAVSDESQAVQLRKQAAEKLLAALDKEPGQPLLAARLVNLGQELQLDWPELAPRLTEALYGAWRSAPRNLLLLVRTGEGLLVQQDARLKEVLDASWQLAQPLLPMMPAARQLAPETLIAQARQAIDMGQWNQVVRVRAWFNVLVGTTAFGADRRLISPDIMALLNTSFLERWRLQLESQGELKPLSVGGIQSDLEPVPGALPEGNADQPLLAAWYDYDMDRDFDILAMRGNRLRITTRESKARALDLDLPIAPKGLLIVDLWTVDSPQRPRVGKPATDSSQAPPEASNSHDTLQELLLWNENTTIVVSPSPPSDQLNVLSDVEGLSSIVGIRDIVPIEIDADGDLDLVVRCDDGLKILQNNGNRTFVEITSYSSLPPAGWTATRMVACDFDRDLDLDLVCASSTAPYLGVMENILHSQMRFRALDDGQWKSGGPLVDLCVAEIDGNASWDWAALSDNQLTSVLTRTPAAGSVAAMSRQELELPGNQAAERLAAVDLNLDGIIDWCLAGSGGISAFLGDGQRAAANGQSLSSTACSRIDVQDADGDGRFELLACAGNQVQILRIRPQRPEAHFVAARIRGINDNVGGRINHFGIGSVLELWADGRYQARVVNSPVTVFGVPGAQATDLRVIFNNGLTQNVIAPASDALIEEVQELKGSCPFVYGWDGERFQLITDLLWNAPLGLQVARGQTLPDRRWENLLLPGRLVQPRDGAVELRVTEELWEVAYFDHLALTAVDHPAEVEVWTNEKVGPPQIAEPRLFTASRKLFPIGARDSHDRDCVDKLRHRDGEYVQAFDRMICQGLCEPHWVELEFDPRAVAGGSDLRLVLTGWMHPTDTSLNIGISQNPDRRLPEPPSLWSPGASGDFVCRQPFMGFPGGKPKTIVVDVSQVFEGGDTRLRIASSQQIYWDQAYLVVDEPPVPLRTETLALHSAELRYRGFSQLMPRTWHQPHWYDYHRSSTDPKWPPLEGLYTRYGDVLPQLRNDDDRMVIMASGDEMILRFALPSEKLPAGWQRDYVLHSVGWDKDADINTLEGQSSLPLPFASMKAYPPPPEQDAESQKIWKLNRDTLTERDAYRRFWTAERLSPIVQPREGRFERPTR